MVKHLHRGFNYPEGSQYAPKNVKIGSLQMFMKNNGSCGDDILVKILISKDHEDGQNVPIPIDHGYCLPENESVMFFLLDSIMKMVTRRC